MLRFLNEQCVVVAPSSPLGQPAQPVSFSAGTQQSCSTQKAQTTRGRDEHAEMDECAGENIQIESDESREDSVQDDYDDEACGTAYTSWGGGGVAREAAEEASHDDQACSTGNDQCSAHQDSLLTGSELVEDAPVAKSGLLNFIEASRRRALQAEPIARRPMLVQAARSTALETPPRRRLAALREGLASPAAKVRSHRGAGGSSAECSSVAGSVVKSSRPVSSYSRQETEDYTRPICKGIVEYMMESREARPVNEDDDMVSTRTPNQQQGSDIPFVAPERDLSSLNTEGSDYEVHSDESDYDAASGASESHDGTDFEGDEVDSDAEKDDSMDEDYSDRKSVV